MGKPELAVPSSLNPPEWIRTIRTAVSATLTPLMHRTLADESASRLSLDHAETLTRGNFHRDIGSKERIQHRKELGTSTTV
jgi:hypothetical protein